MTLTPFEALRPADTVILAVAHREYITGAWPLVAKLLKGAQGIVLDVKSKLDRVQKAEGDCAVAPIDAGRCVAEGAFPNG